MSSPAGVWRMQHGGPLEEGLGGETVAGALGLLCRHAVDVMDVEAAVICVHDEDGTLRYAIGSDEAAVRLPHVNGSDRRAADDGARGVVAVMSQPLSLAGRFSGTLDLYDSSTRAWNPTETQSARSIAQLVTLVVHQASEVDQSRTASEQLREALESRATIEQAKGMIARDHGLSVEAAFALLRRHSRNTNTPVRELAAAVVDLRLQIPATPAESNKSPVTRLDGERRSDR